MVSPTLAPAADTVAPETDTVARIAGAAAEHDLDAVLLLGLENVQFAAQAPLRSASELDRPNLVLVDRSGRGTIFTSQETVSTVGLMTSGFEVLGYDERGAVFPQGIVDRVAEELRARYPERLRLGVEGDRMTLVVQDRLTGLLPGIELVPVEAAVRALRMVKSPQDAATLGEAAGLTEQALRATIDGIREGETERQIADRLIAHMQSVGFSTVDPLVGAGPNARRIGPPTTRAVEAGEWVRIDVKSRYRGYLYTDAGRMAVVGAATPEQHAAYAGQYQLNRRVMDFIKPGLECGDVYRFARRACDDLGLRLFNYGHIGIGHGIGVGGTERPVLHDRDDVVIEAGMVLNIEPNTYGPDDEIMHIEDTLLVTEDGIRPLSHLQDWSSLPTPGAP